MRALCIEKPGIASFTEIDEPPLGPQDVMVRVAYVGYCGGDLNTYRGLLSLVTYPRIPGHEISGVVETVGRAVDEPRLVGRKVVVLPYSNCGVCSACLAGRPNACKNNQTLGVQRDGGLTARIALPVEKVIPVDDLSLVQLAVVEPLAVGFHAVRRGGIGPGDTVAVLGCGVIGLGVVAGAAAAGARVIALDVVPRKLGQARALGASEVVNATAPDVEEQLRKLTGGHGPSVVVEAVGSERTFRQAIDLACYAGRVVYIGYAKGEVSYDTRFFMLKELDIRGSRGAERRDFEAVIGFLGTRPDAADIIVTATAPFAEGPAMLRRWNEDPGAYTKILIDVAGTAAGMPS